MALVNFSLGDIGELAKDIREAVTGEKIKDPYEKARVELQLRQLEQAINLGQIDVNKEEARSPNIFVAGWRPFIGWVVGLAIAYHFIIYPFALFIAELYGHKGLDLPTIDFGVLFNLILAMLGFGGLRTYEKIKNVQNRH